jgi:hypothetical protein
MLCMRRVEGPGSFPSLWFTNYWLKAVERLFDRRAKNFTSFWPCWHCSTSQLVSIPSEPEVTKAESRSDSSTAIPKRHLRYVRPV